MDDDLMEMSPLPRRRGLDRLPLHMQLVTLIGGLVVLVALCGAVAVALVVKLGDDGERPLHQGIASPWISRPASRTLER